jgi:hypothetical protein
MPSLLWRPPASWQQGETVVLETTPWFLPRASAPMITVTSGGRTIRPEVLAVSPEAAPPGAAPLTPAVATDGSLRLPGLTRRNGQLDFYEGPLYSIEPIEASFATNDWSVRLREWSAPPAAAPGGDLPVLFYWQAASAAPQDYNVFLHLRDATGETVARGDAPPTWFTPKPTTTWQAGTDGLAGTIAAHSIAIPPDLEPGVYELVVGWYDWQTGQRLSRVEGVGGNRVGDEFVLGAVTVDPLAGPRPDACCLAAKGCCASKE